MAPFRLQTIGGPTLLGSRGPIDVTDPLALALLVVLGVQGPAGMPEDELLLRLTPEATPSQGRSSLRAAADHLESHLGQAAVERSEGRWRLRPEVVAVDVTSAGARRLRPRDRAAFLRGFTVPRAPEFREWADAVRDRLSPAELSSGGRGRPIGRLVALVAVAIAAGILAWLARTPESVPFTPGDPLLLADLDNATGDTLVDRSLTLAADVALRQSGHLQLVPRSRVAAALRRMQVSGDSAGLTVALAHEVAVREGIRYVVGVRAERRDPGYAVAATLLDAASEQVVGEYQQPAETRAGLLHALDQVLDAVRARLGEPAADRRTRALPLPQVTTPSLEALRSYAVGLQAWEKGNYLLARELWERAVALDTGFAMALGALGSWHYWHNRPLEGERYYRDALRRSGRLTEWERLRLAEASAGYRGDHEAAERIAREIAERFPSGATWYNYGTTLLQASRYEASLEALQRALGFDPGHANTLINLATALKALHRFGAAIASYERAGRYDSTILRRGTVASEYGFALSLAGRPDDAERHFRSLLDSPGLFERALGHRGLGFLALTGGRFDAAVGHFRQATEASRQQRVTTSIGRGRLLEGLALLLAGDSADAHLALLEVAGLARRDTLAPQLLALAGHALVRAGRPSEAAGLLDLLLQTSDTTRLVDRECVGFLSADVLLAQGRAGEALRLLRGIRAYPQEGIVAIRTAEALAAAGQTDSAIARLAAQPMARGFGSETTFDWVASRLLLSELLAQRGRPDEARSVLDDLARQWAAGDLTALPLRTLRLRRAALGR